MEKILIVDDEQDICLLLEKFFSKKGYETHSAQSGEEAIEFLKKNKTDLVICDFKLPDYNGLDILQKIKIIDSNTQVIIITGYSDVKIAVEALKRGAYDYVTKPLFPDEILLTAKNALASESNPATRKKEVKKATPAKDFVIGPSEQSQSIMKHIKLIAPTEMSVIILGETGTGKEYAAKAIHAHSKRANEAFVAVDCGALPGDLAGSELFGHVKGAFTGALNDKQGSFELANGGTLFLDEIGNLTYENQIKLLRVLQERKIKKVGGTNDIDIDVRVLVATNENLKKTVKEGEFREDIYHRLNEFRIELPPLRERVQDIEHFIAHFIEIANRQLDKSVKGFNAQAIKTLMNYHWYGNLRELGNVVKRSVLLSQSDLMGMDCLPPEISEHIKVDNDDIEISFNGKIPRSLKEVAEAAEKKAIVEVLKRTNYNKSKTAELLDVDRKTLYNKLKTYHIEG